MRDNKKENPLGGLLNDLPGNSTIQVENVLSWAEQQNRTVLLPNTTTMCSFISAPKQNTQQAGGLKWTLNAIFLIFSLLCDHYAHYATNTVATHTRTHLESRAFVRGSLAGSLPFQAQLNEKLQQVDQQLVHHLLRLKVGSDVAQGVYHSQGTVSASTVWNKRCDNR